MMRVYVNRPNVRITVHRDLSCPYIEMMRKVGQRKISISRDSMDRGLDEVRNLRFRAQADANDLWLTIDLGDKDFEDATLRYVRSVFGKRYGPLGTCRISSHC
jgi:hypothetical protein